MFVKTNSQVYSPKTAASLPGRVQRETYQSAPGDSYRPAHPEPVGYSGTLMTAGLGCAAAIGIPFASAVAADRFVGAFAGMLGATVGVGIAAVAIPLVTSAVGKADIERYQKTGKSGAFFKPYVVEGNRVKFL